MSDLPPLYIALLLVVVVLGTIGMVVLLRENAQELRRKKMAIIAGRHQGTAGESDQVSRDKRRADLAKKLKESAQDEKKRAHKKQTLRDLMIYAGWDAPVLQFWALSGMLGMLALAAALLMKASPLVMIFSFVIGFFGLPRFILKQMAARRQKKFLEEFADALESMVRLLKAGMPVGEAIAMIAREFHGPLGEEMSRVYENQRIGVPLGEAVMESATRMPLPEMRMFATGILIQQQTGSSLSDVLMNLSSLIRARFRLRRKVHALSAEAKSSAAIIGALPVVVSLGLYFINPNYISLLFTTPTGKMYLMGAICWMSIGVFVMKQMINFKV